MGYKWMARFDDDSELLSPVPYNFFERMRSERKLYGYRVFSRECPVVFQRFVDEYAQTANLSMVSAYGRHGRGSLGVYNNFYVANVAWWRTPGPRAFAAAFDRSLLIFKRRTNDLVLQTAAVGLFMAPQYRKHFTDFSYMHHTIVAGSVIYGGLETGTEDGDWQTTLASYARKYLQRLLTSTRTVTVTLTGTSTPTSPRCPARSRPTPARAALAARVRPTAVTVDLTAAPGTETTAALTTRACARGTGSMRGTRDKRDTRDTRDTRGTRDTKGAA